MVLLVFLEIQGQKESQDQRAVKESEAKREQRESKV